ncbi:MAG: hypothetical protein KBB29_04495 [Bacteroidales bacterium]|nr:hypothetical protein [Bacteroidales bacterium]HOA10306.1 hypothetical protein [Tenuifilaceae bacterium]NLI86976.1 hypothetical protein [Bacteroidales bacterium]HOG72805.1 hypothetical protein [Tenuifilaceae bacterium]HOW20514.1 hypothetical protein [Tenuifilaceae bacterium]
MRFRSKLIWVTLFAIAMGLLESAVVIYMRELLYPGGFSFPLSPIPERLAVTELLRELATLVMLVGVGVVAGRNFPERFAWFIFSFGVWDIFYYVFLKLLIGWPTSMLTWDLLFLIPVTWTGPVVTPVVCSMLMITLALVILRRTGKNPTFRISPLSWVILIAGAMVVFLSFITDYTRFILHSFTLRELWSLPSKQALFDLSVQYIPFSFPWMIFAAGSAVIIAAGIRIFNENR